MCKKKRTPPTVTPVTTSPTSPSLASPPTPPSPPPTRLANGRRIPSLTVLKEGFQFCATMWQP